MAAADLIPYLYRFLKTRQPHCLWEGDRNQLSIALTFDDGPHPLYTPPLLDVLAKYNIKATFFWLGAWVERYPDLARHIYQQGHWIGLHSYEHRAFVGQSTRSIRTSLEKTQHAIAQACQIAPERIIDVRPPYGICSNTTIRHLHHWGYRTVMWSIVPIDWTEPGVAVITQRITNNTCGGDIVVLHDGTSGGPAVTDIAQQIVPHLLTDGLRFITIDEMWSHRSSATLSLKN